MGWSSDPTSRAQSGRASPGSQSQPRLPPRLGAGKQCDRPGLWAGPQPPRPPPGWPRLRPASVSPQPIRLSEAVRTPPSRHLSTNSPSWGRSVRSTAHREGQTGRLSLRPKPGARWRDPRTVAESRTEGITCFKMERPRGEISQEGKEEKLEGETDEKPGDLGWAELSEPRDFPSLLSPQGLWLSCFRFESPPQPLLCPSPLCLLSTVFTSTSLGFPTCLLPMFIMTSIREA